MFFFKNSHVLNFENIYKVLTKIWNSDKNRKFWTKLKNWIKLDIFYQYHTIPYYFDTGSLSKCFFYQTFKFDLAKKLRFFKMFDFGQNFRCWSKFSILVEFFILVEIFSIHPNFSIFKNKGIGNIKPTNQNNFSKDLLFWNINNVLSPYWP